MCSGATGADDYFAVRAAGLISLLPDLRDRSRILVGETHQLDAQHRTTALSTHPSSLLPPSVRMGTGRIRVLLPGISRMAATTLQGSVRRPGRIAVQYRPWGSVISGLEEH